MQIHCVLLSAEKRSELFTVLVKNVLGHSSAKNVCKKGPFLFKVIRRNHDIENEKQE